MAQLYQDFCVYIIDQSCVIRSWFSLIFPNMESNLACRSLHLLDRVVLSHVSVRAWRIVSSPLSIVHYGAAGVFVNTTLYRWRGSIIIAGEDPSSDRALQVYRSIDPTFLFEGGPITSRPWEDRHFLIVGCGLPCGSGHIFCRNEGLGCRDTSPLSDRSSSSLSDT